MDEEELPMGSRREQRQCHHWPCRRAREDKNTRTFPDALAEELFAALDVDSDAAGLAALEGSVAPCGFAENHPIKLFCLRPAAGFWFVGAMVVVALREKNGAKIE